MTRIYIYTNDTAFSEATRRKFVDVLERSDFEVLYNEGDRASLAHRADLVACIGGDGTLLRFLHDCDFPSCPIIGVNTGHLGFFQELRPGDIGEFIDRYRDGRFTIQEISPVEAVVQFDGSGSTLEDPRTGRPAPLADIMDEINRYRVLPDGTSEIHFIGLNELMVRGPLTHLTHLKISIENTEIEDFSGDGILISSPVGSTAYNYSLGGSLVSPSIDAMQLTPMAPATTNAYRSYKSSILLPMEQHVHFIPYDRTAEDTLYFTMDGIEGALNGVKEITVTKASKVVNLIRFNEYNYWAKLKEKLI